MFAQRKLTAPKPYPLTAKKTISEEKSHRLCVVLDIDETLVAGHCFELPSKNIEKFITDTRATLAKKYPTLMRSAIEFRLKRNEEEYVLFHLLHPGMKELLYYIFVELKAKVIFFSAGLRERNTLLVPQLCIYSLGNDLYKKVLAEDRCMVATLPRPMPYDPNNVSKKDLLDVLDANDLLNETVYIENFPAHMIESQKRNMLIVDTAFADDFAADEDDECESYYDPEQGSPIQGPDRVAANHLFYAAGLLATALKLRTKEGVAEKLYELQYNGGYNPIKDLMPLKYFEAGLTLLRTINPNLDFFCKEQFLSVYNESATLTTISLADTSVETSAEEMLSKLNLSENNGPKKSISR